MPATAAERMAAYRNRRRAAGFITLSLVVPKEDGKLFQALASERRQAKGTTTNAAPLRPRSPSILGAAAERRASPGKKHGCSISRAESITAAILTRVMLLDWPIGHSLGSEAELMQQFAVSRPVLRQAIRLLEHLGVARIRRGAGGGLVVAAPDVAATVRAVSIYLEHQRIGSIDILETRKILEQATTLFAVQRLTAAGEARLRADIAAEALLDGNASSEALQRFHFTVAELGADPALRLFAAIVLHLSGVHSNFSRRSRQDRDKVVRRIKKFHRDIANAMLARDAQRACRLMSSYLDGYRDWLG
ncbi:MAG: FadR/GntR family transcriptional regulator [Steroidobacteraceae bacterium]